MKSQSLTRKWGQGANLFGGLHAGIIMGSDEGVLIRPSHEQNVQTNSRKPLGLMTGDPRHVRAHAAKSSTAHAQCPRPIGRKGNRQQRQTSAKLVTFMSGIRRFMNANANLWQKLYARFSEHSFDQANRVPGSHVATHLDVRDPVSMETGRRSQVPNRPIERNNTRHPNLCGCQQARNAKAPNQGGSNELQII
jgi:hypothetical protein